MKGRNVITINQATMLEAMQRYFDEQLTAGHTVKRVSKDATVYSQEESFVIDFGDSEHTAQEPT